MPLQPWMARVTTAAKASSNPYTIAGGIPTAQIAREQDSALRGFAASSLMMGALNVAGRTIQYASNWAMPNVIADPDAIIRLYHANRISWDNMKAVLYNHGISLEPDNAYSLGTRYWMELLHLARSKPSDATALDLYMRDMIGQDELLARLRELGYSNERERNLLSRMTTLLDAGTIHALHLRNDIRPDQADSMLRKLGYVDAEDRSRILGLDTLPDLGLILELYWKGEIGRDEAEDMIYRLGYKDERTRSLILSMDPPLNTQDVMMLKLRGHITTDDASEYLKRMGYRQDVDRERLLSLTDFIPPITDLVRFMIKDVFDEELVQKWGLDEEYELQKERFEFWSQAQGLGTMDLPGNPDGRPINWPQMYYRSAWQYMSPTQGYIALHRFRPNRLHLYRRDVPDIRPFQLGDMRELLKTTDYSRPQRDWLIGSSYNVLTRMDARRMYDIGVLGSKIPDRPVVPGDIDSIAQQSPGSRELYEIHQDQGYTERDSSRVTAFEVLEERNKRTRLVFGNARAVIADAYRTGLIAADQAMVRLYRLRLETPEALAAYNDLPFQEQLVIARNIPEIVQAIVHLDFQADLGVLKDTIRGVMRGYTTGRWSRDEAEDQLRRMGVDNARIIRYLAAWDVRRAGSRKMISVERLVRYTRYGILREADLRRRLENLGYTEADRNAIVGNLGRDIRLDQERQAERVARTETQRQRAMERQLRELQRQQRETQRRLLRISTPGQLSTWVERGILSPDSMYQRLLALGIGANDARLKTNEAIQRREERIARLRRRRSGTPAPT